MAERWFIVPVASGSGQRSTERFPAYVDSDSGPPLIVTPWDAAVLPAHQGFCLVHCPIISDADATLLGRQRGVVEFPEDLTLTLAPRDRNAIERAVGLTLGRDLPVTSTYLAILEELRARIVQVQAGHKANNRRHPSAQAQDADTVARAWARDVIADARRVEAQIRGVG